MRIDALDVAAINRRIEDTRDRGSEYLEKAMMYFEGDGLSDQRPALRDPALHIQAISNVATVLVHLAEIQALLSWRSAMELTIEDGTAENLGATMEVARAHLNIAAMARIATLQDCHPNGALPDAYGRVFTSFLGQTVAYIDKLIDMDPRLVALCDSLNDQIPNCHQRVREGEPAVLTAVEGAARAQAERNFLESLPQRPLSVAAHEFHPRVTEPTVDELAALGLNGGDRRVPRLPSGPVDNAVAVN